MCCQRSSRHRTERETEPEREGERRQSASGDYGGNPGRQQWPGAPFAPRPQDGLWAGPPCLPGPVPGRRRRRRLGAGSRGAVPGARRLQGAGRALVPGASVPGHGGHGEVLVPVHLPLRHHLAGDRRGGHGGDLHLQRPAADQGAVAGAAGGRAAAGAAGRHLLDGPQAQEEEKEGGRLLHL